MLKLPKNKKIILFDGICNLCNASVKFIIRHDANDEFIFASIQSDIGKKIINHIGVDASKVDSIILYLPNVAYYTKADAVFAIAKELNNLIWIMYYLKFIIPKFLRNSIYDYIARNRYKWFGKKDSCMLPTSKIIDKFLN